MTIFRSIFSLAIVAIFGLTAAADTVTTGFNLSDGFITAPINGAAPAAGAFNPVTVQSTTGTFAATFSGGQQQQGFDGPSYQAGPAGYLFVNTGPGSAVFTGTSGNTITGGANNGDQTGSIFFNNFGASSVSFYAADRANGAASSVNIFDTSGGLLTTASIPSGNVANQFFSFNATSLGGNIGSLTFDLPGPAANAPYVLAIDTFSATGATVPEPTSAALIGSLLLTGLCRRRR